MAEPPIPSSYPPPSPATNPPSLQRSKSLSSHDIRIPTSIHLYWVPVSLHPEIAPQEFSHWLKRHSSTPPTPKRRSSLRKSQTITLSEDTTELPDSVREVMEEVGQVVLEVKVGGELKRATRTQKVRGGRKGKGEVGTEEKMEELVQVESTATTTEAVENEQEKSIQSQSIILPTRSSSMDVNMSHVRDSLAFEKGKSTWWTKIISSINTPRQETSMDSTPPSPPSDNAVTSETSTVPYSKENIVDNIIKTPKAKKNWFSTLLSQKSTSSGKEIPTPSPSPPPALPALDDKVMQRLYQLSHYKLTQPKRPLFQQVIISNMLFWYMNVCYEEGIVLEEVDDIMFYEFRQSERKGKKKRKKKRKYIPTAPLIRVDEREDDDDDVPLGLLHQRGIVE